MATAGDNVFGVATSMCQDCLIFISKAAISNEKDYVVTDCEGTRRFQKDGSVEFAEG